MAKRRTDLLLVMLLALGMINLVFRNVNTVLTIAITIVMLVVAAKLVKSVALTNK
ncbi:hypothetical protein [Listeria cornellensis]|uniref:hypothetical protein n=1 Tax=Listeria cornellensis TaxID=1494961 RepID=UPI0004B332D0|nr:hypothetical protein [Listeria cornellensis]